MTPTNDAPVTVEREALAKHLHAARMFTVYARYPDFWETQLAESGKEQWRAVADASIAYHRLAALASAPAGDGEHAACPFCQSEAHTVKSPDGPTWRVGCTSRDCVARPWLTGATIADAWAMWNAALARPRAAVGEREAERIHAELQAEWLATAERDHPGDQVGWGKPAKWLILRAILALQSPPAKVEG